MALDSIIPIVAIVGIVAILAGAFLLARLSKPAEYQGPRYPDRAFVVEAADVAAAAHAPGIPEIGSVHPDDPSLVVSAYYVSRIDRRFQWRVEVSYAPILATVIHAYEGAA
jgi:hypothetical protein